MNEKTEYILSWKNGRKRGPRQVQIHLTNLCNLNCIFCGTKTLLDGSELNSRTELSAERWAELISEGKELDVKEWHICGGGEPMLNLKRAILVMQAIKDAGCYGAIVTNGTNYDENTAKSLVKMGWDHVTISLDSFDPKVHDEIRRKEGTFERATGFVKAINQAKRTHGADKPRICFHSVLCNKNHAEIYLMVELCHSLGVGDLRLDALNVWNESMQYLELGKKDMPVLQESLLKAKRLADKLGISNNFDAYLNTDLLQSANNMHDAHLKDSQEYTASQRAMDAPEIASAACFQPWINLSVYCDGRATPCFYLWKSKEFLSKKSLKEVWFGEYFEEKRREMLKQSLTEDCKRCYTASLTENRSIRDELVKSAQDATQMTGEETGEKELL